VLKRRSFQLLAGLATRRISLTHIIRILRAAREFADGANYLQPLKAARHQGDLT
jgi:hypothetical protein